MEFCGRGEVEKGERVVDSKFGRGEDLSSLIDVLIGYETRFL